MHEELSRLARGLHLAIGGPGLFIIAFLDSSFLSLPQLNDLLVVTMVVQHPQRFAHYAVMATLDPVAGCLALYVVGRRGGKRCCTPGSELDGCSG